MNVAHRTRFHTPTLAAAAMAAAVLLAGSAKADPQFTFVTPAAPPVLPTVLYLVPYAVSDHTGAAQPVGSGVSAETIISIGLPQTATGTCQVQVQWVEWNGVVVGHSGPVGVPFGWTLEFTTVNSPAVVITPYISNVFSNIVLPQRFEGHARILTSPGCPTSLRINAAYVTDSAPSTTGTPSRSVKRHEIKVVRPGGNSGD